jgi:hypothetical protein
MSKSKASIREKLFDAHNVDLQSIFPNIGNIFICPICGNGFPKDDIYKEILDKRDIWPGYIRDTYPQFGNPLVLLCKRCNSTTGSRGDAQMQISQKVKDGEKEGSLYGERKTQFIRDSGVEPINLNASIINFRNNNIFAKINFSAARNNPLDIERFKEITKTGEKGKFQILPNPELKPGIPEVGWITSAFLYAFYTFGYHYMLHPKINPIREFILDSFEGVPNIPEDCTIREYNDKFFDTPELHVMTPFNGEIVHLRICALSYQINLPFQCFTDILTPLIKSYMTKELWESIQKHGVDKAIPSFKVDCTKTIPHDCIWDEILMKK